MPFLYDIQYIIYVLPFLILAMYAQAQVSKNYSYYSQIRNSADLTGAEVARIILDRNNLQHVEINEVSGVLSDHYDPRNETVSLSQGVYGGNSISAASIAAHECGHAIQHAKAYIPLKIRATLVPIVSVSSNFVMILIILGFLFRSNVMVQIGIILFGSTVIFQLVTLPVEFDASKRAITQLEDGLISIEEIDGSKKVLRAAALTYVAATLTAIGQLARLISLNNRNNNRNQR